MGHWSAAQFQAALLASPEVAGLASSPLMLFMVLTILPSIRGDKADQVRPECARPIATVHLLSSRCQRWSRRKVL